MQWNYIRANFARQIFEQQQILRSAIVIRNGPYFSLSHSPSEFLVRRGRATPFACRRKTRPLSESYQFVADLILVWNWYIGLKWSEPYQWCSLSLAASFRVWLSVSAECECMWNYATVALACVYTICTSNAIWPANFLMAYFAYRFKSNLEIENCIRNSLLLLLCWVCLCRRLLYSLAVVCALTRCCYFCQFSRYNLILRSIFMLQSLLIRTIYYHCSSCRMLIHSQAVFW